ncbi:outer membrane beta-barrel protein [Hyphomicrobiales bacterium]|jgi:outer membrane protein|nr:outer membrane beta-barrel protein [Hyphomicrobiales bacterium]MDA9904051.1 outer membrane beta-barrel protein [Hyphomicrobiales bacterium]|tara:strand:+ start:2388 stop:3065 length:678 start_codon:yes stop_codon:yes gene_type:complete
MKKQLIKKLFTLIPTLVLALLISITVLPQASVAQDNTAFKSAGKWLIGLKVLNLDPDVESATSIGGEATVDDDTVPELDIRYFITDNIAIEAILGTTEHNVAAVGTALGNVNLGTVKVLPPTFTLQYHFNSESRFLPYIGAGINYTFFYDDNPGDAVGISYKDDFGFALNIGFDYVINENNYFNIDIKKYTLSTDTVIDAGAAGIATASVDLDPLAISIGYGWRF